MTLLGIDRYYSFEIKFINPLYLNRKINYKFEKNNSTLLVLDKNKLYMKAKINFSEIPNKSFSKINLKTIDMIKTPQNVLQKNLYKNKEIETYFSGDISMCETLFPNLSRLIGAGLISQIASLSEIIGMKVPGENSIFSKAKITLRNELITKPSIFITKTDERFKKVNLKCNYPYLSAELEAFFTPQSFQSKSCNQLAFEFKKSDFRKSKALIIGGSRGIGSIVARLITIGGGDASITYNHGKEEAKKIQREINEWGGNCKIYKFNILQDNISEFIGKNFNQIFYCATPKIKENKNVDIDQDLYEKYFEYYVKGLEKIYDSKFLENIKKIFYPSTIFLDENNKNYREYCLAKKNGEDFCNLFEKLNISVLKPRLPKFLTDQTNSILPQKTENIYTTLIPFLIEMNDI